MTELQQQYSFLADPLLSKYQQKKDPNLLEIARVSHKELPVSNLYAYFLDRNESHGLGSLFLDSLIELLPFNAFVIGDEQVRIEREVYTYGTGKFIDLVITDGLQIIIIENKVYATLYNDLQTYKNHFESENLTGIVLSVKKEKNTGDFITITHNEWISKVMANFKAKTEIKLDNRQQYNFDTFVETLKNMNNTVEDLENSIEFFRTNAKEIEALQKMQAVYLKTILAKIVEAVVLTDFGAQSEQKEISIQYVFRDVPSLIFYLYFDESDLSTLKAELWIRNSPDLVQKWRNTTGFKVEKVALKEQGMQVRTEANPNGGNSWAPIALKKYELKTTANLLDLSELETDLKGAWTFAFETLKTITKL
jgi:hypothetical protein